jgi:hypothetical protein
LAYPNQLINQENVYQADFSWEKESSVEMPGFPVTQRSVAVLNAGVTRVLPAHPCTHLQLVFSEVLITQLHWTLTCSQPHILT